MSLETRKRMPTRSEKAAVMAKATHLRNFGADVPETVLSRLRILENATMLQPRISVVRAVARACMAMTELMICENKVAPALPRR